MEYAELSLPLKKRRELIAESRGFECRCSKCVDEANSQDQPQQPAGNVEAADLPIAAQNQSVVNPEEEQDFHDLIKCLKQTKPAIDIIRLLDQYRTGEYYRSAFWLRHEPDTTNKGSIVSSTALRFLSQQFPPAPFQLSLGGMLKTHERSATVLLENLMGFERAANHLKECLRYYREKLKIKDESVVPIMCLIALCYALRARQLEGRFPGDKLPGRREISPDLDKDVFGGAPFKMPKVIRSSDGTPIAFVDDDGDEDLAEEPAPKRRRLANQESESADEEGGDHGENNGGPPSPPPGEEEEDQEEEDYYNPSRQFLRQQTHSTCGSCGVVRDLECNFRDLPPVVQAMEEDDDVFYRDCLRLEAIDLALPMWQRCELWIQRAIEAHRLHFGGDFNTLVARMVPEMRSIQKAIVWQQMCNKKDDDESDGNGGDESTPPSSTTAASSSSTTTGNGGASSSSPSSSSSPAAEGGSPDGHQNQEELLDRFVRFLYYKKLFGSGSPKDVSRPATSCSINENGIVTESSGGPEGAALFGVGECGHDEHFLNPYDGRCALCDTKNVEAIFVEDVIHQSWKKARMLTRKNLPAFADDKPYDPQHEYGLRSLASISSFSQEKPPFVLRGIPAKREYCFLPAHTRRGE